ncbi:MAG: polysaccharide deacetylase family protein [Microvirga sp.]
MDDAARIAEAFTAGALIRAVNFHLTPRTREDQYDREFALYARHFEPVTAEDLDDVMTGGRWRKSKPGLILAFYNGYRNNFEVARPLLEKHGLIGWFFIVTGFVNASDQPAFAARHSITPDDPAPDGRMALSWDEVALLDRSHVVASHTRSHARASLGAAELEAEAGGSQRDFVSALGHPVRAFAWNGGAAFGEHPDADRALEAAGFQFVMSNFRIQRLRHWPSGTGQGSMPQANPVRSPST